VKRGFRIAVIRIAAEGDVLARWSAECLAADGCDATSMWHVAAAARVNPRPGLPYFGGRGLWWQWWHDGSDEQLDNAHLSPTGVNASSGIWSSS
jgi:hypothetical protein